MDKTTIKRINNLLVRIGDEGNHRYASNLEKLVSVSPSFLKEPETQ